MKKNRRCYITTDFATAASHNGFRTSYLLGLAHKVHITIEYHSLCPLVGTGTLPPPLSQASVPLPPEPKGEEAHSPAGEGLGCPNSDCCMEKHSAYSVVLRIGNKYRTQEDAQSFLSSSIFERRQSAETAFYHPLCCSIVFACVGGGGASEPCAAT